MCTAISLMSNNTYFGRNMDLDYSFGERVIIIPRNMELNFKKCQLITTHYAILGIGTIIDDYPLLADAINEKGLAFAALNFPDNCKYYDFDNNKINLAPYELGLFILSKCNDINDVKKILKNINIVDIDFSKEVLNTPLHFMFSDKKESLVIETTAEGMKIYDNPYHVLTNNPVFPYHKENVSNYMGLHNDKLENKINKDIGIKNYSFGLGAMFLPGDYSSTSRFIKALFVKSFIKLSDDDKYNINEVFRCLESVLMVDGCVKTAYGYEKTIYSSCYNLNELYLCYKTYEGNEVTKICMMNVDVNGDNLHLYTLNNNFKIIQGN